MDSLEILEKIDNLRKQKGISIYRLTKDACVSHNTLNAWRKRQTMPSINVLEAICDVLGVPIAVIFTDDSASLNELSAENKKMLALWDTLNHSQKIAIMNLILSFQKSN